MTPNKIWPEKSIVYIAYGPIDWAPYDTALGGSEQAIVALSSCWAAKGHEVTVYSRVPSLNYQGVTYEPFNKFNVNDAFETVIIWRSPNFGVLPRIVANKIYLDLHDEPLSNYEMLLPIKHKIAAIMTKSQFQRSCLPSGLQDCARVVPNGLDDKFLTYQPVKEGRKRTKIIYASSYDRGLLVLLLEIFPFIRKYVPEAELHIYYGRGLLDDHFLMLLNYALKQENVYEHGRCNCEDLFEIRKEAGIHCYPLATYETDCLSIKESVLAGCIPVVSKRGVFLERDYVLATTSNEEMIALLVCLMTDENFYNKAWEEVQNQRSSISSWETIANSWF